MLIFIVAGCGAPQSGAVVSDPDLVNTPAVELAKPEESGLSPTITQTPQILTPSRGSGGEGFQLGIIELVVRDMALRLKLDLNEIKVISIENVEWPDGGLGCPLPGADYAQVITPGFRITLEAAGEVYIYHTNTGVAFFQCQDGIPLLPLLLVNPGEIQDGIPWMPVDPLPTVKSGDALVDPVPVD